MIAWVFIGLAAGWWTAFSLFQTERYWQYAVLSLLAAIFCAVKDRRRG